MDDGSGYQYTEFTQYGWAASHGILFGAYETPDASKVNGGLDTTGNTRYRDNAGPYSFGAASMIYNANGGVWSFYISPASTGVDQGVDWGQPVIQMARGGTVSFLKGGIYTVGTVNGVGGLCINGDCKTAWSQVGGSQWTTSGSNIYYNTGNVGIGNTSPSYKLDVSGSVGIDTDAGYGARLNIGRVTTDYPGNSGWPSSWNSSILLSGLNNTSISFHDSGDSVATLRYTDNDFYIGENVGWGVSGLTVGGNFLAGQGDDVISTRGGCVSLGGSVCGVNTVEVVGSLGVQTTITANKVNANQIDPPYTIGGKRYATYALAMTGSKEETAGKLMLSREGARWKGLIDFLKAEEGSDLWLFSKTTNLPRHLDKMTVLLTPAFDGRTWYSVDRESMMVTVYGAPSDGGAAGDYEVSYRFTAPRFDAAKWPNTRSADDVEGMNLDALVR
jgi:hypothetical protein